MRTEGVKIENEEAEKTDFAQEAQAVLAEINHVQILDWSEDEPEAAEEEVAPTPEPNPFPWRAKHSLLPVTIRTYGRNCGNTRDIQEELGHYTIVEHSRYDNRDSQRHVPANKLDSRILNACCGMNGRIMLVAAMHPRTLEVITIGKGLEVLQVTLEMQIYLHKAT